MYLFEKNYSRKNLFTEHGTNVWLEKVVPTIGTVIEDLSPEVMRSFGKIAGYESYDHGKVTNFQVGSYATEV
ncbi:MoaF C-terminal domain-containing protein [Oribacterium sp. KHPX15]|uniref:MoaF C-terminal domain-containing protein n=1 Tax=Oribacterium sp. KHPX15 TaxID=1855342 RepID=UPI003FA58DD8